MIKNLTCIRCPIGCELSAQIEDGKVVSVTGQSCPRGKSYAEEECVRPVRMVTSTVVLRGGVLHMLPVKTSQDIPKDKIFECVRELKGVEISAPVNIGEVIIKNVANTGADIIATRKICAV